MNSRKRVLTALNHAEPDRVPYNLRPSDAARRMLREEQGDPDLDFDEFFQHDVRFVTVPMPKRPDDVPAPEWVPHPAAEAVAACAEAVAAYRRRGLVVCGAYSRGVFEQAKHWFGDAEALTMPFEKPDFLGAQLDRITEWKMAIYGAYARAGVDIVWIGDDLGAQRSLVMSPAQYRQWYRPCHMRIVERLRSLRPEAKIAFHCCGHVTPLIPDLIQLGVDILEAVQPESMDLASLKREFGRDLSFWGGIGCQSVLTRETPEQVAEGVRRTLETMMPGGGYIAAPCHTLTEEMSWENIRTYYQALHHHGTYPHRSGRNRVG